MHQLPSTDVFIGLFFLLGIAYGFILQREKIITALCSVYIGIVIASNFSQTVFDFFNGNKVIANQIWIKSNASTSTIAIILFLASIVLISGTINSRQKKSDENSAMETVIYSALLIALILSTIMNFLPADTQRHYLLTSNCAKYLVNFKTLFVIAPPIMLILLNWKKDKK